MKVADEYNHSSGCIFCSIAKDKKFVLESKYSFMIFDLNPVTEGHSLIITKTHFRNISETSDQELQDSILLVKKTANFLVGKYPKIKGFNYISNQNKIANQIIFHTHIHVIPRY